MTVTIPQTDKTGAYQLQAQVATLAALTDPGSQQLTNQRQIELVNSLIDSQKLDAGSILSTCTYSTTNPLVAAIANMQTLQSGYGALMPAGDAAVTVIQMQRQLVTELMNSGQLTAASVLSTMAYVGAAAN